MKSVTLRDGMERGRRFTNKKMDPTTSKELNEELYMKISCTIVSSGHMGDFVNFFTITQKKKKTFLSSFGIIYYLYYFRR